jgi:hypothetical protein
MKVYISVELQRQVRERFAMLCQLSHGRGFDGCHL